MNAQLETRSRASAWGDIEILEEGTQYRIKRVDIRPGCQMTLHQHYHRSEHWVVTSGTVLIICEDSESLISAGESTYVPPCTPHRLANPGTISARLVEIQNGEYLGEDDLQVLDFQPHPLLRHEEKGLAVATS